MGQQDFYSINPSRTLRDAEVAPQVTSAYTTHLISLVNQETDQIETMTLVNFKALLAGTIPSPPSNAIVVPVGTFQGSTYLAAGVY